VCGCCAGRKEAERARRAAAAEHAKELALFTGETPFRRLERFRIDDL